MNTSPPLQYLTKLVAALGCALIFGLAHAADPLDSLPPEIQVDVLMKRITDAISSGDYKSSLPSFRKLISFNKPLPESFDFYYIEALAKSDTYDSAVEAEERIKQYFSKYGKKGAHYKEVVGHSVDVLPKAHAVREREQARVEAERVSILAREEEKRLRAEKHKQAMIAYETAFAEYQQWESRVLPGDVSSCESRRRENSDRCEALVKKKASAFWVDHAAVQRQGAFCSDLRRYPYSHDCEKDLRKATPPPVRPVE